MIQYWTQTFVLSLSSVIQRPKGNFSHHLWPAVLAGAKCVVPGNVHIPPTEGNGNSRGVGSIQRPKNLKASMKLNCNFQRGWGVLQKMRCMDIFWNYTITVKHCKLQKKWNTLQCISQCHKTCNENCWCKTSCLLFLCQPRIAGEKLFKHLNNLTSTCSSCNSLHFSKPSTANSPQFWSVSDLNSEHLLRLCMLQLGSSLRAIHLTWNKIIIKIPLRW